MYKTLADEDGAVNVIIKPVQQQRTGKGNGGPFVIAFTATVCSGLDPSACASLSVLSVDTYVKGLRLAQYGPFHKVHLQ